MAYQIKAFRTLPGALVPRPPRVCPTRGRYRGGLKSLGDDLATQALNLFPPSPLPVYTGPGSSPGQTLAQQIAAAQQAAAGLIPFTNASGAVIGYRQPSGTAIQAGQNFGVTLPVTDQIMNWLAKPIANGVPISNGIAASGVGALVLIAVVKSGRRQ